MVWSNRAGIGHGSVHFLKNTLERIFVFVGKRQNVGYLHDISHWLAPLEILDARAL